MIRKWFKLNANCIEILTNSTGLKAPEQTFLLETFNSADGHRVSGAQVKPSPSTLFHLPCTGSSNPAIKLLVSHACERTEEPEEEKGFAREESSQEDPDRTEFFELRGPNESAFLVEVNAEDYDEVREKLNELKGDTFHFDKSVLEWFTVKSVLTAEPLVKSKDQKRLAKIHGITTCSDDVQQVEGTDLFTFTNSIHRTNRVKRILEKLQYRVLRVLYRFHPSQRLSGGVEDEKFRICREFLTAVESLPKVISVMHNL